MDQQVTLLECNLDDMTGEALGYALEQLLSAGALDAWFTPIYMKKTRPGVILSILCLPDEAQAFCGLLLRETQTLGVRWHVLHRQVAERRMATVSTAGGDVRCKLKVLDGRVVDAKPSMRIVPRWPGGMCGLCRRWCAPHSGRRRHCWNVETEAM
jgi:uncharacterized protein (DUF111 family)